MTRTATHHFSHDVEFGAQVDIFVLQIGPKTPGILRPVVEVHLGIMPPAPAIVALIEPTE